MYQSLTYEILECGLASWADFLQKLECIVGPAINDMHTDTIVHVMLHKDSGERNNGVFFSLSSILSSFSLSCTYMYIPYPQLLI